MFTPTSAVYSFIDFTPLTHAVNQIIAGYARHYSICEWEVCPPKGDSSFTVRIEFYAASSGSDTRLLDTLCRAFNCRIDHLPTYE